MLDLDGLDGVLVDAPAPLVPSIAFEDLVPEPSVVPLTQPSLPKVARPAPTPVDAAPALPVAVLVGVGVVVMLLVAGGLWAWSSGEVEAPASEAVAVVQLPEVAPTPAPSPEAVPPSTVEPAPAAKAPPPAAEPRRWTVRFAHDTWDHAADLDPVARAAAACSGTIRVRGHSCTLGPKKDRKLVALARAETVATAIAHAGVPAHRIDWAAAALDAPNPFPNTWTGRTQMRRVEVTCHSNPS